MLALLLPAEAGTFTAAQLKKAAGSAKVVRTNPSRTLVPLPSGLYECFVDRIDLRNEELGWIDSRVRIVRAR
ncbi:MAG: hypothetical protein H0T79_12090 [Deltaproteobacteria bacterium]|nr:hypothetical protein [Deltaproteobacteria bacterium]